MLKTNAKKAAENIRLYIPERKNKMTQKYWQVPGGKISDFFREYLTQPHLLIAGATGSGKSVIINGLICTLLASKGPSTEMILVDPKRVELAEYKNLPHTRMYASEPSDILYALMSAVDIMENRYKTMQLQGLKQYPGSDIYIFVDEYADLVTTSKKTIEPFIVRLAQLGRAAKIHLILATQRPTRDIITGQIKVNMDSRIALRCPTSQDSRNIIEMSGAETLPRYGECYYISPDYTQPEHRVVTRIPDEERKQLIDYWLREKPIKRHFWERRRGYQN